MGPSTPPVVGMTPTRRHSVLRPPESKRAAIFAAGSRNSAGIAIGAAGFLFFSLQDALVKWSSADASVLQILTINSAFSLLPVFAYFLAAGSLQSARPTRTSLHLVRGILNLGVYFFGFTAISLIPLADAYAIQFSAPVFVLIFSFLLLRERLRSKELVAVLVGFIGVLVMLRPGSNTLSYGSLAALGAAISYALASILARRMTDTESVPAIMLWPTSVVLVATGIAALPHWQALDFVPFAAIAASGFLGGVAQLCVIEALKRIAASTFAPLQYSMLLWGSVWGWLMWNVLPDRWVIAGSALVVFSGIIILAGARPIKASPEPA